MWSELKESVTAMLLSCDLRWRSQDVPTHCDAPEGFACMHDLAPRWMRG